MRVAAEGPLKTLIIILVAAAVALGLYTLWGPYAVEYEVKTAAKIACNAIIQNQKHNQPGSTTWEQTFVTRARVAGVVLKPGQYAFEVKKDGENWECAMQVAWRSTTMVPFLSDYFTIKPLQIVHRIDYTHKVKRSY
jgi:hypothetical protein